MFKSNSAVRLGGGLANERQRLLEQSEIQPEGSVEGYKARGIKVEADFICPLTQQIMKNPVIAECGHSFEAAAIKNHIDALLQQGKVPYSPVTLAPYGSHKTPTNQGLLRSIEHWHKNIEAHNDPGPVQSWLAYIAPRKDVAFTQPVVLPDGNTVDYDQVFSWIVGSELSPFSPKYKFKQWDLVVPDYNLRNLMQKHGVGGSLQMPPVPAQKIHIHSGDAINAWNTGRQLTWGCGTGIVASVCSLAALVPVLMFCGGSLPASAPVMAAAGSAALCPPAVGVFCWKTYAQEKEFLERGRQRVEKRWRHSVTVTTAPQDTSFSPGEERTIDPMRLPQGMRSFNVVTSASPMNEPPTDGHWARLAPDTDVHSLFNEITTRAAMQSPTPAAPSHETSAPPVQDLHRDA